MTTNGFRGLLAGACVAILSAHLLAQVRAPVNQNQRREQDQRFNANQRLAQNQQSRQDGGLRQNQSSQNQPSQNQSSQGPPRRDSGYSAANRGAGRTVIRRQPNTPRVKLPGGQRSALPAASRFAVFKPDWADDLLPRHQQHLMEILKYWEYTSNQINTYRCRFQRWEYDAVFGPRGDCKTYSVGELKYAKPDKGLFRVDKVMTYQPPRAPGEKARHVEIPGVVGEHWICDGKSIFEHDQRNRKLIQREIPPELSGTAITNGPLPFMFGAKADEILSRYWIRVITPPSVIKKPENQRQYWLEAYPKRPQDAANFLKVHVIIDFQKYLPQGLVMFDRGYRPPQNDSRTVFRFDQRKINFNNNFLKLFMRDFFDVKTPRGWERIVIPADEPGGPSSPPQAGRDRRAARPTKRRR